VLAEAPERKVLAEIVKAVTPVAEIADGKIVETVTALVKELSDLRGQVIVQEIERLVAEKVHKDAPMNDAVKSDRTIVAELVASHKPNSVKRVAEVVEEVVGRDNIKEMIKRTVETVMGPPHRRPGEQQPTEPAGKMLAPRPT